MSAVVSPVGWCSYNYFMIDEAGRYLTPRGGQDARQVRLRAKLEKADVPRKNRPDTGVTVHLSVHLHQHEHPMTEDHGETNPVCYSRRRRSSRGGTFTHCASASLPCHDPVRHVLKNMFGNSEAGRPVHNYLMDFLVN